MGRLWISPQRTHRRERNLSTLLKCEDIEIRTLEFDDLQFRVECINDPKVADTTNFDLPMTLERTVEWFAGLESRSNRIDASIVKGGQLAGFCGLVDIDERSRRAEIYCFVGSGYHGQGIGSQAIALLSEYAFSRLGLHRVYLYTLTYNLAMLRVMDKLGWTLEGTLRRDVLHDGRYLDRHILGLLSEDPGASRVTERCGNGVVGME